MPYLITYTTYDLLTCEVVGEVVEQVECLTDFQLTTLDTSTCETTSENAVADPTCCVELDVGCCECLGGAPIRWTFTIAGITAGPSASTSPSLNGTWVVKWWGQESSLSLHSCGWYSEEEVYCETNNDGRPPWRWRLICNVTGAAVQYSLLGRYCIDSVPTNDREIQFHSPSYLLSDTGNLPERCEGPIELTYSPLAFDSDYVLTVPASITLTKGGQTPSDIEADYYRAEYSTYNFATCTVSDPQCETVTLCFTDNCCLCDAIPTFWRFSWSTTTNPIGTLTAAPNGDYVIGLVKCSTNVNPETYADHTTWKSGAGFYYSGGTLFQPWFVLTCGRPTEAEDSTTRKYRLVVYGYNSLFDSSQVISSTQFDVASVPFPYCIGPLEFPTLSDSFGFGFGNPIVMESY